MERKIKQALCLSWQEASEIISNQLNIALGRRFSAKHGSWTRSIGPCSRLGTFSQSTSSSSCSHTPTPSRRLRRSIFHRGGYDQVAALGAELTVAQESAPPELGTRISHGIRLVDAGHHNGDLIGGKVMDEVIKDAIGYGAKIVGLDDSFEFRCTNAASAARTARTYCSRREICSRGEGAEYDRHGFLLGVLREVYRRQFTAAVIRLKPRGTIRRCPLLEPALPHTQVQARHMRHVPRGTHGYNRQKTGKKDLIPAQPDNLRRQLRGAHSARWLLESGVPVHDEFFYKWYEQIEEMHLKVKAIKGMCSSGGRAHHMGFDVHSAVSQLRYS